MTSGPDDLDRWLAGYSVAAPDGALIGRIIAGAPRRAGIGWTPRAWWSGLGLAGIGGLGALAGMMLATSMVPLHPGHGPGADAEGYAWSYDQPIESEDRT